MPVNDRLVAIYPGSRRVGVACWLTQDGKVAHVAAGSLAREVLEPYLRRFATDTLFVEAKREGGVPVPEVKAFARRALLFAHPGWRDVSLSVLAGLPKRLGALAQNAYRIGFNEIVRRGVSVIGDDVTASPLTWEWVVQHSPPPLHNATDRGY